MAECAHFYGLCGKAQSPEMNWLLFTSMMFTVTNPAYLKLPYGKRPDSGSSTVLACDRAAQCTVQE